MNAVQGVPKNVGFDNCLRRLIVMLKCVLMISAPNLMYKLTNTYYMFRKKQLVKNDQPSPQGWSEGNTAAYVGSSPPTRYDQHKEPTIDTKII